MSRKERTVNTRFLAVSVMSAASIGFAVAGSAQPTAFQAQQMGVPVPVQQPQSIRQNPQYVQQQRARATGRNISDITRQEFTREDCATRFISALDRECHDPNYSPRLGVYAKCQGWTISQLYSAMDKQIRLSMSSQAALSTIQTCAPYRSFALSRWLEMKAIVEESSVRNSAECLLATDRLNAAKACYSIANAYHGNEIELRSMINHTCGQFPDVAYRFTRAINIGLTSSVQVGQNQFTLQLGSSRADNWRNVVEAVLVSYIYQAQAACGNQVDIIPLSPPPPSSGENIISSMQSGFVAQVSGIWGRRAENIIAAGAPVSAMTGQQLEAPQNIKSVYPIRVPNLSLGRARLASIIIDSIIGTEETRDDLDIAIITALGGRRNETNAGIHGIISSLDDGDVFVLRDNQGRCMALQLSAWRLAEVDGTALCASGF
jgi:hypothetical protein